MEMQLDIEFLRPYASTSPSSQWCVRFNVFETPLLVCFSLATDVLGTVKKESSCHTGWLDRCSSLDKEMVDAPIVPSRGE